MEISVLGSLELSLDGVNIELPNSRKTRALIAILALNDRPVGRDQLCSMLWDVPNDPRGSLRWSLSKIRSLLGPAREVLQTTRDTVWLDPESLSLDWRHMAQGMGRVEKLSGLELLQLNTYYRGQFLQGLVLSNCPLFDGWHIPMQEQARRWHTELLLTLSRRQDISEDELLPLARQLVLVAPESEGAHIGLLDCLVAAGREREAYRQFDLSETQLADLAPPESIEKLRAWRRRQKGQKEVQTPASPSDSRDGVSIDVVGAEEPSMAVLPFTDLSGTEEGGLLAYGMTEDVTTLLSQVPGLAVISSHSTFSYSGEEPDVRSVGTELGIRYLVKGTLRQHGNNLRISLQLIETTSRKNLWAEKMDRPMAEIFTIQDDIANGIVGSLDNELVRAELNRARRAPPETLGAWGKVAKAMSYYYHGFSREPVLQAMLLCREAIELAPDYAPAHSLLAFNLAMSTANIYVSDTKSAREEAVSRGRQALELEPDNALVVCHWGAVNGYLGQLETAVITLQRSLELNPNSTLALGQMGRVLIGLGRGGSAINYLDRAERLSPRDMNAFARELYRARALLQMGEYAAAVQAAEISLASNNSWNLAWAVLSVALAAQNETDRARKAMSVARSLEPGVPLKRYEEALGYVSGGDTDRLSELLQYFQIAWVEM